MLLSPFGLYRVHGDSMLPGYKAGQIVMGWHWFRSLKKKDIVIIQHKGLFKLKRIADIKAGQLYLLGDNPASSTDSREFGWLPRSVVIAKLRA